MKNKTKTAKCTAQQGDVLLVRVNSIPAGKRIETRKRLVLAHGESGHSHIIDDDTAVMIQVGEKFYLELARAATVKHEEHNPVTLSPGVWEIGRVKEYDYFSKMERQVID